MSIDDRTIRTADGCEHAETCLKCPLPDCSQSSKQAAKRTTQRDQVVALIRTDMSCDEAAVKLGVSLSTARKLLAMRAEKTESLGTTVPTSKIAKARWMDSHWIAIAQDISRLGLAGTARKWCVTRSAICSVERRNR